MDIDLIFGVAVAVFGGNLLTLCLLLAVREMRNDARINALTIGAFCGPLLIVAATLYLAL